MQEQLISFETAKLAKEKGCYETNIIESNGAFHENTVQFYNDRGHLCTERDYNKNCCFPDEDNYSEIPAPTQSLLQKWLRDVHRIDIHCECNYERDLWTFGYRKKGYNYNHYPLEYNTYEEALEIGLQEALKLIK